MIFIDRKAFNPDEEWLQKANELTKNLLEAKSIEDIHLIIDSNENHWRKLESSLSEISHNKCWYSESRDKYSSYHVDHFRPKKAAIGIDKKDHGGYWWLAFDWQNYRICGGIGNVNKRDKFAVYGGKACSPTDSFEDEMVYFLDPTEEEDILKLTFNSYGEAMPLVVEDWDYERAKYTIQHLKLNGKKLKEARKQVWVDCSTIVSETQELMQKNQKQPSPFRRGQIKEKLKKLKEMVKSSSEFSATAKACLKSTGLGWANNIAA
jgi:uncharacterized protein (TIGR02646 family)